MQWAHDEVCVRVCVCIQCANFSLRFAVESSQFDGDQEEEKKRKK